VQRDQRAFITAPAHTKYATPRGLMGRFFVCASLRGHQGGTARANGPAGRRAAHADFAREILLRRLRVGRHLALDFRPQFRRQALLSFGRAFGLEVDRLPIGDPPHRRITHIAERARHPRRVGMALSRQR
jgi:hypothetical protein